MERRRKKGECSIVVDLSVCVCVCVDVFCLGEIRVYRK